MEDFEFVYMGLTSKPYQLTFIDFDSKISIKLTKKEANEILNQIREKLNDYGDLEE